MMCYDEYGRCLGLSEEIKPVQMTRVFGENGEYIGVIDTGALKEKREKEEEYQKEYQKALDNFKTKEEKKAFAQIFEMIVFVGIGFIPVIGALALLLVYGTGIRMVMKKGGRYKPGAVVIMVVGIVPILIQLGCIGITSFIGKKIVGFFTGATDIGKELGGTNGAYVYEYDEENEDNSEYVEYVEEQIDNVENEETEQNIEYNTVGTLDDVINR